MIVECPNCKKPIEWSAKSPYRPFCSERCKLIDLGAWANDEYAIGSNEPIDPNDIHDDEED